MSHALAAKLVRARESTVTVGGHNFVIRRPTPGEIATMPEGSHFLDFVKRFVVDWDLREVDIVPGGTDVKVPFHREVWETWIVDQQAIYVELAEKIKAAIDAHNAQVEADAKN